MLHSPKRSIKSSSVYSAACLSACLIWGASEAIIVRHDVAPAAYEVKAAEYPAIFSLERQGNRRVCVATLVHEQWALTAEHCLEETSLGRVLEGGEAFQVEVAGAVEFIDAVTVHPLYDQRASTDVDLALLHFSQPLVNPRPLSLATNDSYKGQRVQLLGWGYTGQGLTGRDRDDGRLRSALNRLSDANARLRIEFDDPRIDGSTPEALEGMPSLGDSGGPALVAGESGLVVVGITVGEVMGPAFSEETQGRYGAVAVYEHVARHRQWFEAVFTAGDKKAQ
jgi:secreted trypsin-like serine protease